MSEGETRLGWLGKALLGLVVAAVLLVPADRFNLTPGRAVASDHLFSIVRWEVANLPLKWVNLLRESLPGRKPSREERLAILDEYLSLARQVQKEDDRLEGVLARRGATLAGGSTGREARMSRDYLVELTNSKEDLRTRAEEALEAELDALLSEAGLDSRWGLLFPPVDVRFDQPPTMLVTSRRDRLSLLEAVLLTPDLDVLERDRLEKEILNDYNLSALVDNLAGLSTYPSLVNDLDTLRGVLQTAAHEWLHSYFIFQSFGQNLRRSEEMFTLNETVSDLAGRELGDMTFARMGGDLSVSASRYLSGEDRFPDFTREMRETRRRVGELLDQGEIEEAEQYMKERWWYLRLGGFRLRKLNQAYLAFRSRYAEGASSVSPIGDQVEELRGLLPDIGSFVRTVSKVSSYQEFLDLLERLKMGGGTPSEPWSRSAAG